MEIMEDGNLVDRVRILLQRDMKYYQEKQTVLRETICTGISGGKLDFPRHASFAATKIVAWWEAEFTTTFKESSGLSSTGMKDTGLANCGGVVKHSEPAEFVTMIVDTSEQLLEHLHTLTQEALDHADLTVLTATLGAAALVRNCLWSYNQKTKTSTPAQSSNKIHKCFKSYQEIAEALAERLLDLHCRLISLYILNEADSFDWQSCRPFFEKERCSFVIQMWWLYMQGTKDDLWNTVPPKMAQRVFAGMLDESLTIITARFVHGRPSLARCGQFWADVFNVLCCTANLALATFVSGSEMVGFNMNRLSIISRDIHAKCGELLVSLLLRGTPLNVLFQVLRDGLENLDMSLPRRGPAPWLITSMPDLLPPSSENIDSLKLLADGPAIAIEMKILRAQPQPDWRQLMKTLLMRNSKVSTILLEEFCKQSIGFKSDDSFTEKEKSKVEEEQEGCGGFLCSGHDCSRPASTPALWSYSLTYISIIADMDATDVIIPALLQDSDWSKCLDREQVWNQIRPPWLHAIITPLYPVMAPVVTTLLDAIRTGASIYQTMSLALACFSELYICAPAGLLRTVLKINDNIPAHCHPIGGSVLLQILCTALYTNFLKVKADAGTNSSSFFALNEPQLIAGSLDRNDITALAIALGEAICSIDEDDKHTLQIDSLLDLVNQRVESENLSWRGIDSEGLTSVAEAYADELLFTPEGRLAIKVIHEYIVHSSDWILSCLGIEGEKTMIGAPKYIPGTPVPQPLLHVMFHIGCKPFDQLLIDYMQADWLRVLKIPQAITVERIRSQILKRPEFKEMANLPPGDKEATEALKLLCSTRKASRLI
ncbi:uncharacterized protein LOC105688635 [Athalia rosae]|uniref:uncharacterized protein LOC105688635 n=1 Tax=Athalia rosae TaxID=37344 RepID=UPI002033F938|nr:uncharacterized protein LOC105688635 [Athalia rosae]